MNRASRISITISKYNNLNILQNHNKKLSSYEQLEMSSTGIINQTTRCSEVEIIS